MGQILAVIFHKLTKNHYFCRFWETMTGVCITRWLLRYAPRFHRKKSKKKSPKKFQKKFPKKISIFFSKNQKTFMPKLLRM
jgi:hypothetical protein